MKKVMVVLLKLVLAIGVLSVVSIPALTSMEKKAEFNVEAHKVTKEHREAVYGFNKLATGVTEEGKISEESKKEMMDYLASIPKEDRVYVVKDESFMEVVEYVLTTTDTELSEKYEGRVGESQLKLFTGDAIEDVTLALFKEGFYGKLATSGDEISVPVSSEIVEALMMWYYVFYVFFLIGFMYFLLPFLSTKGKDFVVE